MKKLRPFYSFLLSYIFILLIPVLIGVFVYREIIRVVELEEKKSNLALLSKARDTLDNVMLEIDRMVLQLGNDPYVRRFAILEDPIEGSSTYYLYELERRLSAYYERSRFIHSMALYFRNSNSIFMRDGFYETRSFYRDRFHFNGMDFEEWEEIFLKSSHEKSCFPAAPVTLGSLSFNALTYVHSFPAVYRENPTIVIWLLIDEDVIKELLKDISVDGSVYILNEDSEVMASLVESGSALIADSSHFSGEEGFIRDVIENQKVIVSYTTSFSQNWRYVSVIPFRTVLVRTLFARWLMSGIGLAVLILGFITAYLLALRSTRPLRELVRVVKEKLPSGDSLDRNEYDFIRKNVNQIADLNRSLLREMKEQLPLLRAAFFERLFRGEYTTEAEVREVLSRLGIDVKEGCFLVILAHINVYNDTQFNGRLNSLFGAKAVIKNLIGRKFRTRLHVHDRAEDEVVLLMCLEASEAGRYRSIAEELLFQIYNTLLKEYDIHVSFSAGKLYSRLTDTWHSYREGAEVSDTMRISRDFGINWYEERTENKSDYYYPLGVEERLMNNARAGNRKEAIDILSLVYRENIENRSLSADMLKFLVNNMRCSIIKLLRQRYLNQSREKIPIIERVKDLRHCETFDEAYSVIEEIYEEICDIIDRMKKSHNQELIERIKDYIRTNHGKPGLNLYEVAHAFDMAEAYLSSFFKEQNGIRFSDYLEEVRMKSACEMLSDKNIPINSIAQDTGYGSVKAFSRAFKRVKGVIPTDFRKIM